MIDVIMVTYNRIKLTKKTLDSIWKRTKTPYRLIVIDNASSDGTLEFLRSKELNGKIHVLETNKENIGLERALQQGFQHVRSDCFVTTDNDCLCPDLSPLDWLGQLKYYLDTRDEYAAIALRPQVLIGVGPIFKDGGNVVENNVVGGSYRMFKTDEVKDVGGWSDRFVNDGRGNEEHDICGKLRAKGWKVGYTKDIWTYHQWGDEKWGYENVDHKMGRSLDQAPKDQPYDKKTCEPKVKSNE